MTYVKGMLCRQIYKYHSAKNGSDKVMLCPKQISQKLGMNVGPINDLQLQQLLRNSVRRIQRLPQKCNNGYDPQGLHLSQIQNAQEFSVNETLKFKGKIETISQIQIIEQSVLLVISQQIQSGYEPLLLQCLFPSLVWVRYINLRKTFRAQVYICLLLQFLLSQQHIIIQKHIIIANTSVACYGNFV